MIAIGIMQGRLSPPEGGRIQFFPRLRWREEFALAAEAGFDRIEWLYDSWGEVYNPIATDEGVQTMEYLSKNTGVAVTSLYAHHLAERPVVKNGKGEIWKLEWLTERCAAAGIQQVTVPFTGEGSILTEDDERCALEVLQRALVAAAKCSVELHLETELAPAAYARFLESLGAPEIRVSYDTGNSASLGYDIDDELAAYGPRIGSVHIQDRARGGASVPLGTGDANLRRQIGSLLEAGYSGNFVLETARGEPGEELGWAKRNLEVLRDALK